MIYNKVCLMVPTYGRSKTLLPTFIRSAMANTRPSSMHFCFCVNTNDAETTNYLNKFNFGEFTHEIVFEQTVRPNLAHYYNLMYDKTITKNEPGTLVSMVGDDMEFQTPGWETTLFLWVNRYNGIGVFFCNDTNRAKHNCPVNLFVSRKMVDLTGQPFMAPEFEAEMVDIVWYWVGKDTKTLHYFPEVIIHHNHSTQYKEQDQDSTFKRLRVIQKEVHKRGGKDLAIRIGKDIAQRLLSKSIPGIPGDSDC